MSLPRRTFRWRYLLLGGVGIFGLLLLLLVLSFRMGGEARALRAAVFRSGAGGWDRQIELGVGRVPVWLAQGVARWLPLPSEAQAGIATLRFGDVGIYQHRRGPERPDPDLVLDDIRQTMARRGWEAVVAVRDGNQTVAIFTPKEAQASLRFDVCGVVLNDRELVLFSGRANTGPLIPLIDAFWREKWEGVEGWERLFTAHP